MATQKKTTTVDDAFNDLYVCMYDAQEKRRNILQCIKNSLVMQEEYEKVLELRKNKKIILKEIKTAMKEVDRDYQDLKKVLPNVKGVLSYTEKEIEELETEVSNLTSTLEMDKESLSLAKQTTAKLQGFDEELKPKRKSTTKKVTTKKKTTKKVAKKTVAKKVDPPKELSKLDRIKNNLKVIEGKIKDM